jgi:hypothetical protein
MKDIKGVLTIVIIFVFVSIIWIIISNFIGLKPLENKISFENIEINLKSDDIEKTFSFYSSILDFNLINKNDSNLILQNKNNTAINFKFYGRHLINKISLKTSNSLQNIREILDKNKIKYSFSIGYEIAFYDLDSNLITITEIK